MPRRRCSSRCSDLNQLRGAVGAQAEVRGAELEDGRVGHPAVRTRGHQYPSIGNYPAVAGGYWRGGGAHGFVLAGSTLANWLASGRRAHLLAGRSAMSSFRHIPLGHTIPDCPHAISVSLPTMADLIGYEEKSPEVMRHMSTGYPRFVQHPFVRLLTAELARRQGLQGQSVWLVASLHLAEQLRAWLGADDARVVVEGTQAAVVFAPSPEHNARAKAFLQHCGGSVSSRQAEDALVAAGLVPAPKPETCVARDADALGAVRMALRRGFTGATDQDLFVASNGMNAIHSVFRTSNQIQRPRGRTVWIQLGWIYLDTIAILQKFTDEPQRDHVVLPDVNDLDALRRILEERRGQVAGIVTEVPTNPLIQSCDVPALAELARAHGAHLVLDASIASPWNVDVLRYCDVAVASLTKYAASEGDLLMGAVAVNPLGGDAAAFRSGLAAAVAPPYRRDLARLAHEIRDVENVLARINAATPQVAEYLEKRPEVARVHWALAPAARENFLKVARNPAAVGSMVSFELQGLSFARVYDRMRLPKGPSFGLRNSLCCPFMYLAHYDLVTSEAGRAQLAQHRLNPGLLRLSVGIEPVGDLVGVLGEALDLAAVA